MLQRLFMPWYLRQRARWLLLERLRSGRGPAPGH